jgi:hypothetical protein
MDRKAMPDERAMDREAMPGATPVEAIVRDVVTVA